MKSLILFLSLVTVSTFASELSFYISKSKNLILKSNSCDELIEERNNLCTWKESLDKTFVSESIRTCNKSKYGGYYLSVSSCLPDFIKKNQSKSLSKDGANCWGTAMSFYNISKVPRFVWSQEIRYWQSSPLCEKVKSKEEIKTGDIINIYGPEYIFNRSEVSKGSQFEDILYPNKALETNIKEDYSGYHNFLHSEIYISKNLSFGKDSPNQLDKFIFKSQSEVYGRAKDIDCQENQSLVPNLREYKNKPRDIRNSKCGYFSIAFRCQDFDKFIKEQNLTDDNIRELIIIEDLKNIQTRLFKFQTLKKFSLFKYEIERLTNLADKVSDNALKTLEDEHLTKVDEMILTMKYFTASGIRKTLEQTYLIPATELL